MTPLVPLNVFLQDSSTFDDVQLGDSYGGEEEKKKLKDITYSVL